MSTAKLYEYFTQKPTDQILIVENESEAELACEIASFLDQKALAFPDLRASHLDDLRSYTEELSQLFIALKSYAKQADAPLAVIPIKTLFTAFPKQALLQEYPIAFGDTIEDKSFKDRMHYWGYSFVDIVQMPGEISFRGDIIDIYSPDAKRPVRISLFDDEIESIRYFDLDTQKSEKEELESCLVLPAFLSLSKEQYETIMDRIESHHSNFLSADIHASGFWFLEELSQFWIKEKQAVMLADFQMTLEDAYALDAPAVERSYFDALEIVAEPKHYRDLVVVNALDLIQLHKEKAITVISRNSSALKQEGLGSDLNIEIVEAGYTFSVMSDSEMILSINHKVKKSKKRKASIILDELKPGDYVVHEDYGVALFRGIEQATIMGATKDFVALVYQGEDKVLVPVDALEVVDRYVADSGSLPALDRLGKGSFAKLKEKVKEKLFKIASEIINLAASRALLKAPKICVDSDELAHFQSRSGFEYTKDQAQSIAEIIDEMQSGRVMDRLLSGDVGFGKTEVAMNAIFAAVKSGYQSALVVPTTLLSNQHYHSLIERFNAVGFRVRKLDRFSSAKEKKITIEGLLDGSVDVVVGTHALFGVKVKNLGLVIIDEEHKFGVKQKEQLKELYETTHLLSMSATPIPRSLNMALSQIKTMSQLLTPPMERKGVRTFVKDYDQKLVKEVIKREQRRGGQIFYVFNNIAHMEGKKHQLLDFMPDLKIVALHSKISAVTTEKEMLAFEAGEYDVMLATSIIESGIHMPNVNTMIIDGADRFGIADLHQLRGRVGRGDTEGYCYFFVEDKAQLTPESTKRLLALESNSYLGSGQALAYHDLEIRGGGNLIGDAQSGHIKQIGYSLYLRMLEDAISTLSNHEEHERKKIDLKLSVSAYLSDRVVSEDRLRIELYRRLSLCEIPKEIYEIEEESMDRFGALDEPTKQFFELMVAKLLALNLDIKSLSNYGENISIEYNDGTKEMIKSRSKDDDDILATLLAYLREKIKVEK